MKRLLDGVGYRDVEYAKFGMLFPFYYLHVLLVSNRVTFVSGHRISQCFDAMAGSLIFVARRAATP